MSGKVRQPLRPAWCKSRDDGRGFRDGQGMTADYAGSRFIRATGSYQPISCLVTAAELPERFFNFCENAARFSGQNADLFPHFTGAFATHYYIQPGQYFYRVPGNVPDHVAAGANCGCRRCCSRWIAPR